MRKVYNSYDEMIAAQAKEREEALAEYDPIGELEAEAEHEAWLFSDEYQEMEDRKNQHVDTIEEWDEETEE